VFAPSRHRHSSTVKPHIPPTPTTIPTRTKKMARREGKGPGGLKGAKKRAASDDEGNMPRASKKSKADDEDDTAPVPPKWSTDAEGNQYIAVRRPVMSFPIKPANVRGSSTPAASDASQSVRSKARSLSTFANTTRKTASGSPDQRCVFFMNGCMSGTDVNRA
jgi:hypothetical protein